MPRFTSQEEFVRSALVRPCFLHREEGDLGLDEAQKLPSERRGEQLWHAESHGTGAMWLALHNCNVGWHYTGVLQASLE